VRKSIALIVRQAGQRTHSHQYRARTAAPIVGENSMGIRLAWRSFQAAIELWGTAGPPDHLSNLSICREVAQWLNKNDRATHISDATILRAVGRK